MTLTFRPLIALLALIMLIAFYLAPITRASTLSDYCATSVELELLRLINDHRAANGVGPLTLSWTLSAAAQHHSIDIAANEHYSHTLSDGTTWLQNIINHGYEYSYRGENIAWGYTSAQSVFNAWKNSSGHNSNMLNSGFKAIGVDLTIDNDEHIDYAWTNTFGGTADAQAPSCDSGTTPTGSVSVQPTAVPTLTPTPRPTDTTFPTVSITYPLNGSTVTRRSSVEIQATASDNIGVQRVEFYISGKKKCTDSLAPYTCLWSVPNKPNGKYNITARAYDTAGNITNSTNVSVTSQ